MCKCRQVSETLRNAVDSGGMVRGAKKGTGRELERVGACPKPPINSSAAYCTKCTHLSGSDGQYDCWHDSRQ